MPSDSESPWVPPPLAPNPATWLRLEAAAVAFPVMLAGLACCGWYLQGRPGLPAPAQFLVGLLPYHVLGAGTVVVWTLWRVGWRRIPQTLELAGAGRALPPAWRLAWPALLWLYPVNSVLTVAATWGLHGIDGKAPIAPLMDLLRLRGGPGLFVVTTVAVTTLAPLAEELLFRLVMHDALVAVGAPRLAAGVTALAFAAVHGVPEQLPALFVLGLVLQNLRRRGASLWPAVLLHAAYNAVSMGLVAWLWGAGQGA